MIDVDAVANFERRLSVLVDAIEQLKRLEPPAESEGLIGIARWFRDFHDSMRTMTMVPDADYLTRFAEGVEHTLREMRRAEPPSADEASEVLVERDWLCYGKIASILRANTTEWNASYGYPHYVGVNPCDVVNDETGSGFQLKAGEKVDTGQTLYLSLPGGTSRTLAVGDLVGYVPAWRPKIWAAHGGPQGHVVYGAPKDAGLPILDASQIDKAIMFWHSAVEPDTLYEYTTGWTIYSGLSGKFPVGVLAEDPDFGAINDSGGAKTHTHTSVSINQGAGGAVAVSSFVAASHLPPFKVTNFIRWNGLTV